MFALNKVWLINYKRFYQNQRILWRATHIMSYNHTKPGYETAAVLILSHVE